MVAVAAVTTLVLPTGRSAAGPILRTALSRQLLVPYFFLAAWAALVIWLGWRISIWDIGLTTTTLIAFVTTGSVLFGKAASATALTEAHFFRRTVTATMSAAAILAAYVSITPLPLWAEAFLGIALLFAGLRYAVASTQVRDAGCAKALVFLFFAVVLGEVIYVSVNLAANRVRTDGRALLKGLLLPVWLTAGLLPLVYVLAVYSVYQRAVTSVVLTRLQAGGLSRKSRARAWVALTVELRLNSAMVRGFGNPWASDLAGAKSLKAARAVVRDARTAFGRPASGSC